MRKRIIFLAALALILAPFVRPTLAQAAPATLLVRDQTAEALFDNTDGCINTTVFIVASKSMSRSIPGSPSRTAGATIDINRIDTCADVLLMDAHAAASRLNDFEINTRLNRATMHTRFQVHDFVTESDFNMEVEVTWRGIGALTFQNTHDHFEGQDCTSDSFLVGASRAAVASIDVSDERRHYQGAGSRLVRGQSTNADIMWVNSGQVQNGCI